MRESTECTVKFQDEGVIRVADFEELNEFLEYDS